MIEALLPDGVASVGATTDLHGPLSPQEEAHVLPAVPKRQREFRTVRLCARRALAELGVVAEPILPGPRGEPRWPEGVVGSMTHCDGYRAAAVARREVVRTLGIDAEPHAPLPEGVLGVVALPEEQARIRTGGIGGVHEDRLLFSAKESVFKSCFPVTGVALDFDEAELTFAVGPDPRSGTFQAHLRRSVAPLPDVLVGRWRVAGGLVLTAITVTVD